MKCVSLNGDRDRTDQWTWGSREERGGGLCGESDMETYIIICKTDSQWELAVNNLEGWDGERDGSEVQEGRNTCIPVADSC